MVSEDLDVVLAGCPSHPFVGLHHRRWGDDPQLAVLDAAPFLEFARWMHRSDKGRPRIALLKHVCPADGAASPLNFMLRGVLCLPGSSVHVEEPIGLDLVQDLIE